jgi:putative transposase
MSNAAYGVDPQFQIPDSLWERMEPLLPAPKPKKKPGRPRMDDRRAMTGILYRLRTGCQWKAIPRSIGPGSTIHDRFQEWGAAGVFQHLWQEGVLRYDEMEGLDWEWQAMDTSMTKAPLGGKR